MSAQPQDLPLVIVVAIGANGVIGDGSDLLWRLPSDLKHFKAVTLGKPMIMGRRTWDSIGRALPGRESIVVTRDRAFRAAGALVAHSLDEALALAQTRGRAMGAREVILAGGGDLYAQLMDRAAKLVVTEVDAEPEGETRFPAIDPSQWRETFRETHEAGPGDDTGFRFVTYERHARSALAG